MIRLLAALLLAFSLISAKSVSPNYATYVLSPVDEASKENSFVEFRKQLIQAIDNKDAAFLTASLAKNIAFGFGDHGYGDGPAGFRRMWKLDKNPEKSKVWELLSRVVKNGGTFSSDHTSFEAPYIWAAWPQKFPAYSFVAVNAKDVKVQSKPSESSPLVQTISYEIVRLVARGKGKPESWAEVQLPSGQRAYIQNRFLESAVGYRARFEWNKKEWKIATFIAGE